MAGIMGTGSYSGRLVTTDSKVPSRWAGPMAMMSNCLIDSADWNTEAT
jgi:hypothetical protein